MAQFKRKSAGAVYTANASFTWTISGIALVACGGGGGGADTLDGGDGEDGVSYFHASAGVTVSLSASKDEDGFIIGHSGLEAEGDRLINIENLHGSEFDDTLIGDHGDNDLFGGQGADRIESQAGNDWLIGGLGGDILDGGRGNDTASYWQSDVGVTINLQGPVDSQGYITGHQGGHAAGDILRSIENIAGSNHNDVLIGDEQNNEFWGYDGVDTIEGGEGGDVFAISHIASDIENACVITDFSMDDNDWLDFSAYIDALWYDQSRSVNTGEASNDSSQNDTVLYGKADGSEVVIVLEDFSDTDFFMAISRASIELHAFEAEIV